MGARVSKNQEHFVSDVLAVEAVMNIMYIVDSDFREITPIKVEKGYEILAFLHPKSPHVWRSSPHRGRFHPRAMLNRHLHHTFSQAI